MFLERSRSTPISVTIEGPYHDLDHTTTVDLLNQHATRIETLTITAIVHPICVLHPTPILRKLDLSLDRIQSLRTEVDGQAGRLTFPTVTTLIVRGGDAFPVQCPSTHHTPSPPPPRTRDGTSYFVS